MKKRNALLYHIKLAVPILQNRSDKKKNFKSQTTGQTSPKIYRNGGQYKYHVNKSVVKIEKTEITLSLWEIET